MNFITLDLMSNDGSIYEWSVLSNELETGYSVVHVVASNGNVHYFFIILL